MTVYTFPTLTKVPTPNQLDWALVGNTQSFSSPLSGAVQTVEMPGARWKAAFTLSVLEAADSATLRAFLAQLRGQSGRFYLWNMARPTPRGIATGTPVVSGAGQTGTTLVTSGWTISTTNIMRVGDFFTVNGELKMCTADANSNGSGVATLSFEPPLRASPSNGAALTTNKPTATFKLDDDVMRWTTTLPNWDSVSISATEAW